MDFLKKQELSKIKVTDICEKAQINRGTFYANFLDVYDLAEKLHKRLAAEVIPFFAPKTDFSYSDAEFLRLFEHIKNNQSLYYCYFKLGLDYGEDLNLYDTFPKSTNYPQEHLDYHISFFAGGLNAIIKKWLDSGCDKSPQEMTKILLCEYHGRY